MFRVLVTLCIFVVIDSTKIKVDQEFLCSMPRKIWSFRAFYYERYYLTPNEELGDSGISTLWNVFRRPTISKHREEFELSAGDFLLNNYREIYMDVVHNCTTNGAFIRAQIHLGNVARDKQYETFEGRYVMDNRLS